MHETVFATSLLRIVLEETARYEVASGRRCRVARIGLKIGRLACLEEKTLRGCFELLAEEGAAAGAELTVERPLMRGFCPECGQAVKTEGPLACPLCGGYGVSWQGGREMEIASIEVVPLENDEQP